MRLITERDRIKEAIQEFRKNWGEGSYPSDKRNREIGKELGQLNPETVTVEIVNEMIGNSSWTRITCHECNQYVKAAMELGQELDYGSATATICLDCLEKVAYIITKNYP